MAIDDRRTNNRCSSGDRQVALVRACSEICPLFKMLMVEEKNGLGVATAVLAGGS